MSKNQDKLTHCTEMPLSSGMHDHIIDAVVYRYAKEEVPLLKAEELYTLSLKDINMLSEKMKDEHPNLKHLSFILLYQYLQLSRLFTSTFIKNKDFDYFSYKSFDTPEQEEIVQLWLKKCDTYYNELFLTLSKTKKIEKSIKELEELYEQKKQGIFLEEEILITQEYIIELYYAYRKGAEKELKQNVYKLYERVNSISEVSDFVNRSERDISFLLELRKK